MRILIAPDSFKDALPAVDAAKAIADGIGYVLNESEYTTDALAMSDGGEGFVHAMSYSLGESSMHLVETTDPLGRPIRGRYALAQATQSQPCTAVIELADASGLERLRCMSATPPRPRPSARARSSAMPSTAAAQRILLGIGGSATTDAALGIAQALGIVIQDEAGRVIKRPITGSDLANVARGNTDWRTHDPRIHPRVRRPSRHPPDRLRCHQPAARPQRRGAHLRPAKRRIPRTSRTTRRRPAANSRLCGTTPGCPSSPTSPAQGAAGGVGGGLVAMLGAELSPGAELVLDAVGFDERLAQADLVITGEGRLDRQSLNGKAAMAVAKRAKAAGVPCIALVGCVGDGAEHALEQGLTAYHIIGEGLPPEQSIAQTAKLLTQTTATIIEQYIPH
ncbi:glycerate kinase [Phycisphaeraceae bacterium D3-23]